MIKCKNCGMVIGDNGYGYCEPCWWNMTPDAATKVIDPLNLLNGQRSIAPEPEKDENCPLGKRKCLHFEKGENITKDNCNALHEWIENLRICPFTPEIWNAAVEECVKVIEKSNNRLFTWPQDGGKKQIISAMQAIKK